jgi:hypothetical protein
MATAGTAATRTGDSRTPVDERDSAAPRVPLLLLNGLRGEEREK